MNQIKKEDINDENILDVLKKAGVDFEEGEVVSTDFSIGGAIKEPTDFVVVLDGIYQNVKILTKPFDDEIGEKLVSNFCALYVNLNYSDNCGAGIILSLCEDSKEMCKTYGCFKVLVKIYSLKGMSLD